MIYVHELINRNLNPMEQCALFMALNTAAEGASVTVYLTAPKVTNTAPRIADVNYVAIPGLDPSAQIGTLSVKRYVDNADNRRQERVNEVYFKIKSVTRADGFRDHGWANLRPSQITSFKILGVNTARVETEAAEMATVALAKAAQAQAQTPTVGA